MTARPPVRTERCTWQSSDLPSTISTNSKHRSVTPSGQSSTPSRPWATTGRSTSGPRSARTSRISSSSTTSAARSPSTCSTGVPPITAAPPATTSSRSAPTGCGGRARHGRSRSLAVIATPSTSSSSRSPATPANLAAWCDRSWCCPGAPAPRRARCWHPDSVIRPTPCWCGRPTTWAAVCSSSSTARDRLRPRRPRSSGCSASWSSTAWSITPWHRCS